MTRRASTCPNCGAPVEFAWSAAVQTTCAHCRSVVVRHDLDLKTIGELSDIPENSSPIQIGVRGEFDRQAFQVVGRIAYEYDGGGWNEWHLVFADNSSGWLSDAQAEYAVSRQVAPPRPLPAARDLTVGRTLLYDGAALTVATITVARYQGVEGELPFEYWGRDAVTFADLRNPDGLFGTIDYSETPPLLFLGRFVEFDALALRGVREFPGVVVRSVPSPRGFNCRNCGAAIELRALTHTRAVACTSCAAVIDPRDRNLVVLQEAAARERYTPLVPLGTRGTFEGHPYDVIGFQYREITVEGTAYGWSEYVLFNPYQGFRYLSEYRGHWNFIRPLPTLPTVTGAARPSVELGGWTFRHFQTATAVTKYVLGEFPWRVRVGDAVATRDFIAPPLLLSSESTDNEVTWSRGSYLTGREVWKACGLPGPPPKAEGVFANQPSPHTGRPARYWKTFAALAALLVVALLGRLVTADREVVFDRQYAYAAQPGSEPAFVTPPFDVRADGTLSLDLESNLNNAWVYLDLALLDAATGTALNVGGEMERYSGTDADGPWTEGSGATSVVVPWVTAGQYYLRVEPQGPTPTNYRLQVRRDVVLFWPYVLAFVLLLVPPVLVSLRAGAFESRRWQESDYGSSSGGGGDDDSDSDSDGDSDSGADD